MALKPPIAGDKPYRVEYSSNQTTKGTTLVSVVFTPRPNQTVPHPESFVVAPAATDGVEGRLPSKAAARMMEVHVDLPDGAGSGTLGVIVDGADVSRETLTEDSKWVFIIK